MTRNLTLAIALLTLSAASMQSASAQSATTYNTTVDVYDTSGPEFISGDGIKIDGFAQTDAAPGSTYNTISVAVKARDRDTGEPNAIVSGNRYLIDPGFSSNNPAVSNLAFDYQFDPGINDSTNYRLELQLDFDPAYGATDFVTFNLPIYDGDGSVDSTVDSWRETDGFFANPHGGSNAWNDDTVPYVISNSTRLDFGFFSASPFNKTYDPNAPGEYEIRLTAYTPDGTTSLASVNAFAVVVPEPTSLALAGLGLCGLATLRRRRKA